MYDVVKQICYTVFVCFKPTFLTAVLSADDRAMSILIPYINSSEKRSNSRAVPINADVMI